MTLKEMKDNIVEILYQYKSYELPGICVEIGLEGGTEEEAGSNKKAYIRKRILSFSKERIIELILEMEKYFNILILPEHKYSYKITSITKSAITKILLNGTNIKEDIYDRFVKIKWNGDLEEIDFIKRVCDIDLIPVQDTRCKNFYQEYIRHREVNDDYEDDYFFALERLPYKNADDETFFKILCEIFHPEVRDENGEWKEVLTAIGDQLRKDGFEFYTIGYISEREIYGIRKITFLDDSSIVLTNEGIKIADKIDNKNIRSLILLLNNMVEKDSTVAIGKAKEIIEATCKYILGELNIRYEPKTKIKLLNSEVCKALSIYRTEDNVKIAGVEQVLGSLMNICDGMSEIRNVYGDGHGKDKSFRPLPKRYGRLAANSAVAYVEFLLDTYEEKILKNHKKD